MLAVLDASSRGPSIRNSTALVAVSLRSARCLTLCSRSCSWRVFSIGSEQQQQLQPSHSGIWLQPSGGDVQQIHTGQDHDEPTNRTVADVVGIVVVADCCSARRRSCCCFLSLFVVAAVTASLLLVLLFYRGYCCFSGRHTSVTHAHMIGSNNDRHRQQALTER